MKLKDTKTSIVERYGQLAKVAKGNIVSKFFACCDLSEQAKSVATAIGYSDAQIQEVPENSNLGVGCGNPSALASIQEGDTVVDLGSGAGFDAFIVSRQVGPTGKVIGIDLSEDMLKLANRNALRGNYQNTSFKKGDIEDVPLESNIADHVISNCVINLSDRKDKVYQEAYRILKPGGKVSISDIILERDLPDFIKHSLAGQVACVSGAEKLEIYISYVKEAGFTNIEIVDKKAFPLELMLLDPQINKIAKTMNFDVTSEEAKDIASRVKSISLIATK
jgi:SAM-dependent methyltransferase